MKKFIRVIIAVVIALAIILVVRKNQGSNPIGADGKDQITSVCESKGGKIETQVTQKSEQVQMCVFAGGTGCEAKTFVKGICNKVE
ncbi:MAG: DUF333 domain-containing protein [candidate division SR1 bacterium]|nr:DUF333 domain-containing protein [candidate division SR1 bacterium]